MTGSAVLVTRNGGVTTLTLNRPESRNAMSLAMVDELLAALDAAAQDGETRVIVLRGAGGHFCSGGDLKDMAAARGGGVDSIAKVNRRFGELCAAVVASPLAIVAVLEGGVMGGGFGLACAADVAMCDTSANFRLPETSLGLVPAQIAPYLVERLGYSQAKRLAVTGGRIDGKTAEKIGLVHACFADTSELDAGLEATVKDILACAPHALAATKNLVARARLNTPAALIDDAANAFALAATSAEGAEGVMAFVQKRAASWVVK
ncbi:MAG: enoyl-CoA hydratase/isomerase family protein [Rhodocyclaceae bacterium]|nr:enoyl-CoA hydratase/isomerase family protein [Rhodocyclaceae bacterium]